MSHRPDARALASMAIAAGLLLGGCSLFKATSRPAPDLKVEATPAKVKRGEYLAKHLNACLSCHTPHSEAHLPIPGQEGAGGRKFAREDGLPGNLYATNLTPDPETGLGTWSDGEIARAVREGVSKDGHALFPLMPYPNYAQMPDEDVEAIIAYLRQLKPIKSQPPARELDFPLNLIVNTIPKPLAGPVGPAPAEGVARGKHVLTQASCNECHTPMTKGQPDMERYLAGGHTFKADGKAFVMPNLTSDPEKGLGKWTDKQIEDAIRFGRRPDGRPLSPVMPWPMYGGMNEADMQALIAYVRTLPAKK